MNIKINRQILIIITAIFLSLLVVHIFGSYSFSFQGLEFNVQTSLAYRGVTQHVSDLHNNPAGIEVVRRMAELFQVDFIIDTGDISDFGTPLEGLLLGRINSLPVPYLFLAGNHDSSSIISKMKELKGNVMVLENSIEINGFRIVGFHDPAAHTNDIKSVSPAEEEQFAKQIENVLVKLDKPVDILAVHSPYVARPLAGLAPVLLFGHNHQFNVEKVGYSVLINAGTSGASGLGTLQEVEKKPYSVMLLNFYHDGKVNRLIAVDSIQIDSVTSEFSMQRHLFDWIEGSDKGVLDSPEARDIRSRLEKNR